MSRRIDDAGELMLGARKHEFGHGLSVADIADLPDSEAAALVVKDKVWPLPDYAALIDAGRPPRLVALLKIVRDRLPKKPVMNHRDQMDLTGLELRRHYIEMISAIRELAETWADEDDAMRTAGKILADLGWNEGGWRDASVRARLRTVQIGRASTTFSVDRSDVAKAAELVRQGFPNIEPEPAWKKGVKVRMDRNGSLFAVKAKKIVASGAKDEAALDEMLRLAWEQKRAERKAGASEPPRRPQGMLEDRSGMPDWRGGIDIAPDEFISTFGFRGVQFGESLPDVERQAVINHAYDALKDLAEILGVEDHAISLHGRLGAAFGARGQGGAPAHYEPGMRLFNITRANGAGSLAHEWGHGFDDLMGELVLQGANKGNTVYASSLNAFNNAPVPLGDMWMAVVSAMVSRERSREEALAKAEGNLEALVANEANAVAIKERETAKERPDRKYLRKVEVYLASIAKNIAILSKSVELLKDPRAKPPFGKRPSNYLNEAQALCGKSGEYWKRRHELFARAFESAVFDALAQRGASSPFLVHGVEEDRYADKAVWKGNPYPSGDERRSMSSLIPPMVAQGLQDLKHEPANSAPLAGP